MKGIFEKTGINSLDFAMSVASRKHKVVAENIANADTPNFKSKDLKFEQVMGDFYGTGKKLPLAGTNEKHFSRPEVPPVVNEYVYRQNNPSVRNDGNDVNLDYEMSELSSNAVLFQSMTTMTSHEFSRLKSAILGR